MVVHQPKLPLLFLIAFSLIDIGKAITELDFSPVPFRLPYPPALEPNNKLLGAKRILVNKLSAPESLFIEDGGRTIYTGTSDGKLLKIVDGQIVRSMHINGGNDSQTCDTYDMQPICGWPHGIRRLSPDHLVVVDSYLGLFKFNLDKGEIVQLLPGDHKFDRSGTKCALYNSLDVVQNGSTILISCCSTRWDNRRAIHDFFEGRPNGLLISFDVASGRARIVLDKLNFANGVQAHPDGQSVLVSELTRARIVRYFFAGPRRGQRTMFALNMPGFPDNIKLSATGTSFFVGMDMVRHSELLTTTERLGPFPAIRHSIVMIPQQNLRSFFGANLLVRKGLVLELDLNGKIIDTYQDPTGTVVPGVSEAVDNGTHLFLGSSSATYISIVPK